MGAHESMRTRTFSWDGRCTRDGLLGLHVDNTSSNVVVGPMDSCGWFVGASWFLVAGGWC